MSDGNFNRALLPRNELSAGLRAGKAQMRTKAERAFDEVLNTIVSKYSITPSHEDMEELKKYFMDLLRK